MFIAINKNNPTPDKNKKIENTFAQQEKEVIGIKISSVLKVNGNNQRACSNNFTTQTTHHYISGARSDETPSLHKAKSQNNKPEIFKASTIKIKKNVTDIIADSNNRTEAQTEGFHHEYVLESINDLIESEEYSSEIIDLITPFKNVRTKLEFKENFDVLIKALDLYIKRLDRAIEVDYKAYLPNKAPVLYDEWKNQDINKGKNALDCLKENYSQHLSLGVLFQDDLGGKNGLDNKLKLAIDNYCNARKIDISSVIKPKMEKTNKLISQLDLKKALISKNLYAKAIKNKK